MPQLKDQGNWDEFAAQFPVYLRQLNLGQGEPGEEQKLAHLDPCLPQVARQELQKRREQGEMVQFQSFWNYLQKKYGRDTQSQGREQLRNLRPRHDGKVTLALGINMPLILTYGIKGWITRQRRKFRV